MNPADVEDKLHELHMETFSDPLQLDQPFRDQGYDSLDKVEFVMKVEKEYNLTIPDGCFDDLHTPRQIVNYVVANVKES